MDAWLAHIGSIERIRPATRAVVGLKTEVIRGPSFQDHLNAALAGPGSSNGGPAALASWGELYCREAGLLLTMPVAAPVLDEEDLHQVDLKRIDPTHAA